MNTLSEQELLDIARYSASISWAKFKVMYSSLLLRGPEIIFNKRLITTAGRAHLMDDKIDLCLSMYRENMDAFHEDTIPHEQAHHVAYRLFGDKGHGPKWKEVMRAYGLPGDRCHNMTSSVIEARKVRK